MNVLTDKVTPSSSSVEVRVETPAEDVRERTEREVREAARSAKLVQGAIACGTLLVRGAKIIFIVFPCIVDRSGEFRLDPGIYTVYSSNIIFTPPQPWPSGSGSCSSAPAASI